MLNRSFRVSYPAQAKMPVLHRSSAVFRERLKAGTAPVKVWMTGMMAKMYCAAATGDNPS